MMIPPLRVLFVLCTTLLLTACPAPNTPQEVSQRFWSAVQQNDSDEAVRYSTLAAAQDYDAFSQNWDDFEANWGTVIINGDRASIESEFSRNNGKALEQRRFTTYLLRQDEQWKVDYLRTSESLEGGALGRLFGQLGEVGRNLAQRLSASSVELSADLERLGERLQTQSEAYRRQTEDKLERYSEKLQRDMEALADSVERALEERRERLSDRDRKTLRAVADDLNDRRDDLDEPTMQNVTAGSKSTEAAHRQLATIDAQAIGKQNKQQWHEWQAAFEADLQNMLDTLSASLNASAKL